MCCESASAQPRRSPLHLHCRRWQQATAHPCGCGGCGPGGHSDLPLAVPADHAPRVRPAITTPPPLACRPCLPAFLPASSTAALLGLILLCPHSAKRGASVGFIVRSATAMEEGQALLSPKASRAATPRPSPHLASATCERRGHSSCPPCPCTSQGAHPPGELESVVGDAMHWC